MCLVPRWNPSPWRYELGCLCLALLLCAASAAASTVTVRAQEPGRVITAEARILEDPDGTLYFDEVRDRETGWEPGPPGALMFGYSHSTYWLHWHLDNATDQPRSLILDLGTPLQDYVDWHVVRGGGRSITGVNSGDRLPYAQRPKPLARSLALPLDLAEREAVDVYVRVATHDGLHEALPARLFGRAEFLATISRQDVLLTLHHGGLLGLALFYLLLFFATRERSLGLYVAYVLSVLLWSVTVAAGLSFGLFGLFAIDYMRLKSSVPLWMLRTNQVFACASIAAVVPASADLYALGGAITNAAGIGTIVAALSTGSYLLLRGQRQARFFMAAFTVVGIGAAASVLHIMALAPTNLLTTWGVQIGASIQVLVLALGLADAMNQLKADKLKAERQARLAQQEMTGQLEALVEERTRALEDANARLQALAMTDELTGAYNRRHFSAFCDAVLARGTRDDPLAFCIFDLDNFKAYNDLYGHQAGDEALRAVSEAVQQALKRSGDALVRLGGEEFGVLFTARSAARACEFAERLRKVVLDLQILHNGNPGGVLTASFGVCWRPSDSGPTAELLYEMADRQLYAAKAAGRNLVSIDPGDDVAVEAAG